MFILLSPFSARADSARCHLKSSRQRGPQMTTWALLPESRTSKTLLIWVYPVRSFVLLLVLGATRAQKRGSHCLAALSSAHPLEEEQCQFYLNDSPSSLPLDHPATAQGTARPMAAAKNLPGLVMTSALIVTLLGGPTSRPQLYVPDLPVRHSFRTQAFDARMRFRGVETRSTPLPSSCDCSRFGTVSIRTHSQALSRLSWLSFSSPGV